MLLSSGVRAGTSGVKGEIPRGIDQGQSRVSVEDLYQSMEGSCTSRNRSYDVRSTTFVSGERESRLSSPLCVCVFLTLSFSLNRIQPKVRGRIHKSIRSDRPVCSLTSVTLANWLLCCAIRDYMRLSGKSRCFPSDLTNSRSNNPPTR